MCFDCQLAANGSEPSLNRRPRGRFLQRERYSGKRDTVASMEEGEEDAWGRGRRGRNQDESEKKKDEERSGQWKCKPTDAHRLMKGLGLEWVGGQQV